MIEYKSTKEYLKEIGEKLKQYRIAKGLSQQELEEKSGVSVKSISRLEQGSSSVQLENFIKLLAALDLGDNINLLIPDQTQRPSYYIVPKKPQRASKKKAATKQFHWGDETK